MLQAVEELLVIVGCDVEQLYPSMKKEQVAKIMEEAIRKTDIKWMDLDYMEGCRFIALNKTQEWCVQSKLRRVLPRRRGRCKPKVTSKGPMGPERGDQEQWTFPEVVLTEEEKREVMATVVGIIVELLFSTHLYTFGGEVSSRKMGAP